jgi:hypothetical protein
VGGEGDPVYSAAPASGIAASDIANWDAAYNWGDHQAAGYLVSEVDGDASNELQTLSVNDFEVTISSGNSVIVGDQGWELGFGDTQWSTNAGNLGIGTTTPDNKLDVNGKVSLTQSPGDEMVIINDNIWQHGSGDQDFGTGGAHFFVASRETDYESAGIYGDGNTLSLWSPGDANNGQPAALVYFMDEDRFDGAVDANPHNNNSVYAYINSAGAFVQVSDARRKENIQQLSGTLDRLMQVNAFRYQHRLVPEEIEKGQVSEPAFGFLAQDLERHFPEVVERSDDGDYYVSYMELVPVMVEALKEQQFQIRQAESTNSALEARLQDLEARLATLEAN